MTSDTLIKRDKAPPVLRFSPKKLRDVCVLFFQNIYLHNNNNNKEPREKKKKKRKKSLLVILF
jgi:hypothetical protein